MALLKIVDVVAEKKALEAEIIESSVVCGHLATLAEAGVTLYEFDSTLEHMKKVSRGEWWRNCLPWNLVRTGGLFLPLILAVLLMARQGFSTSTFVIGIAMLWVQLGILYLMKGPGKNKFRIGFYLWNLRWSSCAFKSEAWDVPLRLKTEAERLENALGGEVYFSAFIVSLRKCFTKPATLRNPRVQDVFLIWVPDNDQDSRYVVAHFDDEEYYPQMRSEDGRYAFEEL